MTGISIRYRAALALARALAWASRHLLHRGGNVIGGAVMLRLAGGGIAAKARRHRITIVTGTNGKSTTTAMITAALRVRGAVDTNADGSNTSHGLAWCVATAKAHEIVLEVDESWLPWAVDTFGPAAAVLLNLTRDQLHRRPEIQPMAAAWRTALQAVPCAVAVAEDPAVVWAAYGARRTEFASTGDGWTSDTVLCPQCGEVLHDRREVWACNCGLTMPAATVEIRDQRIVVDGQDLGIYERLPGHVNVVNAAVALAATRDQVEPTRALAAIAEQVGDVAGRYRDVTVEGRRTRLLLAKNPAGWQAVLGMLREGASILLVFSAEGVDGRDTSWLYDVSFEGLRGRPTAVAGQRGTDLAVRLHLDGIDVGDLHRSVRSALMALPEGEVDVVATYASFQTVRRELHVA
ncbi:MAG: MurT ligase domain-containing protein [Nocardioidaceae bacterium]|nr:MurT ligase domain-containing protein [Nocardioidaceae bacterium]